MTTPPEMVAEAKSDLFHALMCVSSNREDANTVMVAIDKLIEARLYLLAGALQNQRSL